MLYEFCHFASTDRALESTTPSELLTPFILVFITNLTKVCASWYLGSQSILRVYINHQVHGCILQRCHSKASTQIVLWNDSFPRSKYLLGSYLPYLFGSQRLMSVSCPPCPIRFIMVDLCLDFGSFFFFFPISIGIYALQVFISVSTQFLAHCSLWIAINFSLIPHCLLQLLTHLLFQTEFYIL